MSRVTTKVLRKQLRQMIADDLVAREDLEPKHLGVRYTITPYGCSLDPVFGALWGWGRRHLARRAAWRGTMASAPARALS